MGRLSKEQVELIVRLRREGLTYKQIADKLNISEQTAIYWCVPSFRRRKINRERARQKLLGITPRWSKEKLREWFKRKYHTDPEFKRKVLEATKKYIKTHWYCRKCNKWWKKTLPFCPKCGKQQPSKKSK